MIITFLSQSTLNPICPKRIFLLHKNPRYYRTHLQKKASCNWLSFQVLKNNDIAWMWMSLFMGHSSLEMEFFMKCPSLKTIFIPSHWITFMQCGCHFCKGNANFSKAIIIFHNASLCRTLMILPHIQCHGLKMKLSSKSKSLHWPIISQVEWNDLNNECHVDIFNAHPKIMGVPQHKS